MFGLRSLTLVMMLAVFGASASAESYTLVPLGTLGGPISVGSDINRGRQAVGNSLNSSLTLKAFVWEDGVMADLGTLGGTYSFANHVNQNGDITGAAAIAGNTEVHAVVWSAMGATDLGTINGYLSAQGVAIGNDGTVVGEANVRPIGGFALPISQAFVVDINGMSALPTLGGRYSRGNSISEGGKIIGTAEASDAPNFHAVMWSKAQNGTWSIQDLGTLPGFTSAAANAINRSGVIVGWGYNNTFSLSQAFYYKDGMVALPGLGGNRSAANAINEEKQIVGWSEIPGFSIRHAVMWVNDKITDLNTLLPEGSAWVLNTASAINTRGDIVGTGTDPSGNSQAFMLRKNR